ncbi:hypothetical protein [Acetobacter vaccinii]|uniref:Secreted protein n=1 Tax=Acetobacter vaccinii TaxID=2592655 RepID=A0A5C1YQD6_9PROT|nr:hypothetical protein [Acetobacter vaccinii]QEO17012.1 hypothetical protein FLP30_04030 [Acetobacter vaccinii]
MSGFRFQAPFVAALAIACTLITPAMADEDGPPTPRDNSVNIQLQKELAVLHLKPDAASPACIDALRELHKTQDLLKKHAEEDQNPDLVVAQDILESDFETASERCAPDVRAMCEAPNPATDVVKTCEKIDSLPDQNERSAQ